MSRRRKNTPELHHVQVVIRDDVGIVLTCERREKADRDALSFTLVQRGENEHEVSTSWLLDEAEPFLEQLLPLLDDVERLPICGRLEIRARKKQQPSLAVEIAEHDDETAIIALCDDSRVAVMTVQRPVLRRFVVGCLETICDDMKGDDNDSGSSR